MFFLNTVFSHTALLGLTQKEHVLMYSYCIILHFVLSDVVNWKGFILPKRQNHATFTEPFKYHSTLKNQFRNR